MLKKHSKHSKQYFEERRMYMEEELYMKELYMKSTKYENEMVEVKWRIKKSNETQINTEI